MAGYKIYRLRRQKPSACVSYKSITYVAIPVNAYERTLAFEVSRGSIRSQLVPWVGSETMKAMKGKVQVSTTEFSL